MLTLAGVFVLANLFACISIRYTNVLMRNNAITRCAEHSLLLDESGGRFDDDVKQTITALDATYPYNHTPNYRLGISVQLLFSMFCFAAAQSYFASTQGLFLAGIVSIFGGLAILDAMTTWLPRQHSIALCAVSLLGGALGLNPLPLSLLDLLAGAGIAFFLATIANYVSMAAKGLQSITEGDAYFLMAMGALIGPDVIYILFVAVCIQLITTKLKVLTQPKDASGHAPFGPSLFLALLAFLLASH